MVLLPVLPVRLDDLGQGVVQRKELGCVDRADVGVPDLPVVVVHQQVPWREICELSPGELRGLDAAWAVDLLQPARKPGGGVLAVIALERLDAVRRTQRLFQTSA